MNDIEVRINKEVRDYQEGIFFGLTLRQFLCALGAVAVALAVYFFLGPALGGSDVGWACVLAAAPFALCGFYRYNSMTFEQFILAVIRSELLYPKRLVFKSDHLYTKALENTTIAWALSNGQTHISCRYAFIHAEFHQTFTKLRLFHAVFHLFSD